MIAEVKVTERQWEGEDETKALCQTKRGGDRWP